jgi:hypothetical protein
VQFLQLKDIASAILKWLVGRRLILTHPQTFPALN